MLCFPLCWTSPIYPSTVKSRFCVLCLPFGLTIISVRENKPQEPPSSCVVYGNRFDSPTTHWWCSLSWMGSSAVPEPNHTYVDELEIGCVAINACVNDRAKELNSTWPLSRRDVWAERKNHATKDYDRSQLKFVVVGRSSSCLLTATCFSHSPRFASSFLVLHICGEFFSSLIVCAKNPKRSWSKNFF